MTMDEIRKKADALKMDVQFAIIMAEASAAPFAALQMNKAEEIYKLLNEISNGGKEE